MKRPIILILVLSVGLIMTACSGDSDDPGRHQLHIDMLASGVWVPQTVINSADGDLTEHFDGFTMVFLKANSGQFDGDFYVSEGGPAFPEVSGKWKLKDDLSAIQFSDGREGKVQIEPGHLVIEIDAVSEGGRIKGLGGRYTFTLKHRN